MNYLKELLVVVVVIIQVKTKMIAMPKSSSNMIKQLPKVVPKGPLNLPNVNMPKWSSINRFFQTGEKFQNAWNTLENTADFLSKVRDLVKKNGKSENGDRLEQGWKEYEFVQCFPDDPKKTCFSECTRGTKTYRWCYISSEKSSWDHCYCEIRPSIQKWLVLNREKLMTKKTTYAVTQIQAQWIAIGTVGSIFLLIILGLLGRFLCLRKRGQQNMAQNNNNNNDDNNNDEMNEMNEL